MKNWPKVPLHDLIQRRKDEITVQDLDLYSRLTIHMNGQGISIRDHVPGNLIGTKQQFVVKTGQLILSKIDARNGAFGIVPEDGNGAIITGNFWAFDIDHQLLDGHFFNYLTKTPLFIDFCIRASDGTTNRRYLQETKFLNQNIFLPPLEEQRRIVARIEELAAKIAEARGLRREAEEETESLLPSFLSETFDYNIDDILPNKWKWQPLEYLLVDEKGGITTGPFGTLLQKSDMHLEGIPVLGIANIQPNRFIPHFTDYIDSDKAEELSTYKLIAEDIVIARSGTVGRCCVLPNNITPSPVMSTNLMRLRLNKKAFIPELLGQLFNGSSLIERYKEEECYGSTRAFFTQKMLLKLTIPVPPLDEQRRIVAHLDALQARVDALKRMQAESSAELNALLPSILDKAFKGEL